MRSNSKRLILTCALVALLSSACRDMKVPPAGAYPATVKDRLLIHNFEDPNNTTWPAAVNPDLYNLILPVGGMTLNGTGASMLRAYGVPQGIRGVQMTGTLVDGADGTFPSHQLRLGLKSGSSYFNISFFSGIKFWLKLPDKGDAVLKNWFNVYLRETTPLLDGGECDNSAGGCYNHFYVNMEYTCNQASGGCGYGVGWEQKSYTWDQFVRESWGNPVYPSTLSGDNLTEVILFEWQAKRNNVAGTSYPDIYIDEVRFF